MSLTQWTCTPRVFPTSGFELLGQSIRLDEETLPTYQPEKYYPVNQGEILSVWLAKDLIASTYVVLKVYVTGQGRDHERELRIYKQINGVGTKHPGRNVIRIFLDHFDIHGPHGRHVCLVHEPLGTTADVLVRMSPAHVITLVSLAEKVEGEDKEGFLRWLRMALQWNPEDRPTALELLYDEWLMKGLGE